MPKSHIEEFDDAEFADLNAILIGENLFELIRALVWHLDQQLVRPVPLVVKKGRCHGRRLRG
jgi:hypothetical protein